MEYKIPDDEVDNIIGLYWQLLGVVESNTDPEKDKLNKILVEGAYKALRRSGITDSKPIWLR